MPKKPRRLINLFVKNIAAVGAPSNRRKFLVIKSEGEHMQKEHTLETALARVAELEAAEKAAADKAEEVRKAAEEAEKNAPKAPDAKSLGILGNAMAALFGRSAGASDEVIAELEKSAGVKEPIPEAIAEQLAKSEQVAADAKAANDELKKSNDELAKSVADMKEAQELRKFADEVAGYKEIGLDPTKDHELLKSVTENMSEEHSGRIREIFKSAVAAKAASGMFGEVGSNAPGQPAGSVAEEVEQAIDGVVSKSADKELTREAAQDAVFRNDPALHDRWRRETTVGL